MTRDSYAQTSAVIALRGSRHSRAGRLVCAKGGRWAEFQSGRFQLNGLDSASKKICQRLRERIAVIAEGKFEGDGQSHCAQLPLFTSIVQSTGQCVRILPENGTNDPFGMLFKDGATDSALIIGDSRKVLTQTPEGVFQTCVTSPPYRSLRNYNIPGQIGLELSLNGYIQNVVEVSEQVRLVRAGTPCPAGRRNPLAEHRRLIYLRWPHMARPRQKNPIRAMDIRPPTPEGLKPKDLIGVPWRLVFALQAAGWFLRADIIWNKPNCQPESVKDRPTRCHEYVFLFSKSERYFYDHEVIRGPNEGTSG